MVKHNQTIRRLLPTNCLSVFGHFVELALKGLRKKWCVLISKRLGYVKRKSTTAKPITPPGLILEIGLTFYNEINKIVQAHDIPAQMIINIDQTPLPFVLISNYTLVEKCTSRVSALGTSDYPQVTDTFGVTMLNEILISYIEGKSK